MTQRKRQALAERRDGAARWTAAGMFEAEAQFHRVIGYRQLPLHIAALEREMHPSEEVGIVEAA